MGLFTTQAEWKQRVEALETDLQSANTELETARGELTACQTELAEARESLSSAPTAEQVAKLEADLATAEAAAAPAVIEAKAVELASAENPPEAIQKVIAQRVTEELAGSGHDKPIADFDQSAKGPTPHLDRFEELKGAAATSYFREFKKQINAEARLRK